MNILIDNRSGTPIYDQIYTQVKQQIISGELTEDEALPSIRSLAKDLRISVITREPAEDRGADAGDFASGPRLRSGYQRTVGNAASAK